MVYLNNNKNNIYMKKTLSYKKRKLRKRKITRKRKGGTADGTDNPMFSNTTDISKPSDTTRRTTRRPSNRGRTLRVADHRSLKPNGPTIIDKTDGTTFYSGKYGVSDRYNGDVILKDYKYLPHGRGTMEYKIGDVYRGEWQEGKRHGTGSYFIPKDDKTFKGKWVGDSFVPSPL